jgi:sugar (pentulose or hexulose) kinase
MNCTNIMNEVREAFGLGYDDIEALAMDEAPGCSGMNMLPFLTGERTPNWPTATAAVLGIGPGMLRPGLLYRAAMEGATFALLAGMLVVQRTIQAIVHPGSCKEGRQHFCAGFATMQELGFAAEDVRLVGGGSRSK